MGALSSKSCINVLYDLNNNTFESSKYRRRLINDQISLTGRIYTDKPCIPIIAQWAMIA
jgi:hypothetical protein